MAGMRINEVCVSLGVSASTLQNWRRKNTGPEWKLDYRGRVWYSDAGVEKWRNRSFDPFAANTAPVKPAIYQDPPGRVPFTPPPFITEQAARVWENDGEITVRTRALPKPDDAELQRRQKLGEIRPAGVPAHAEWDTHHIAWVWEEDGETVMADSDGGRI